ncbi:uncharacterized protein LOC129942267 [Eupeodes corollae]|uniref:uncharacterized protein LOC129942267 n=1 Tax=Eupeodes corollae TaxID=290404 RepID=UPI0024931053|nr:uncharacterized protein LOC129942267 [Eupeodes corollae]
MSFLTPLSSQKRRRTFTNSAGTDDSQGDVFATTSAQSSNYAYINENRKQKDPMLESAKMLSNNISELIECQKNKLKQATFPLQLQNFTMLANIDRMLQKLPEDIVEDINIRFICIINEEIKKYKRGNSGQ